MFRSLNKIPLGIWHIKFTKKTGQAIANFVEETCALTVEEKLDHADAEAQVKHERMDNNAEEWKTNEWKFSVGNVAIAGKRITKTNDKSPFAKIPISRIVRLEAQENTQISFHTRVREDGRPRIIFILRYLVLKVK